MNNIAERTAVDIGVVEQVIQQSHYKYISNMKLKKLDAQVEEIPAKDVVCLFKISELVSRQEENLNESLTTVINALHACGASCIMLLQCRNGRSELYVGAVNKKRYDNVFYLNTIRDVLKSGIEGNMPGTELEELVSKRRIENVLKECIDNGFDSQCITSVSCVAAASFGQESRNDGIEKLLESIGQKSFSIVVLADPVDDGEMLVNRRGYEQMSTGLSSLESVSSSRQTGMNRTVSENYSEGITRSLTESVTLSQSHSESSGWSRGSSDKAQGGVTDKLKSGAAIGAGVGLFLTGNVIGASFVTNTLNTVLGVGSASVNDSVNGGTSDQQSLAEQSGKTEGTTFTGSYGESQTESESMTVQTSVKDRRIHDMLERIDSYLKWLDKCENYGMFKCCTYIISGNAGTNLMVASQYQALLRGENDILQPVAINTWTRENGVETVRRHLMHMMHPTVTANGMDSEFTPAMLISGRELAVQMALPKKSVVGVSVTEYAPFGREVVSKRKQASGKLAEIGVISHMGRTDGNRPVWLDVQSLAAHTFIAGTNGSGKSNTVFKLIEELNGAGIPFLVIEPAKGEYKNVFGHEKNVSVYGTNQRKTKLLRINPFWFNEDIDVREHIINLMAVFNASWPMYSAMPQVLQASIENAYKNLGWDLNKSVCRGERIFPTVKDVLAEFRKKMDQTAFSQEVKGNYEGALTVRLESLCNGVFENIFSGADLGDEALFESNVIIDLSRVGSAETKAMLMGMLIIRLQEHRTRGGSMNHPLKHVTILEEAHHLLRRTSTAQSDEGSNLTGKSVEMISAAIAEMRSAGEGFMIVDQSPGLLDQSVIRNTNTKIMLRLPDGEDRELVGRAMGLTNRQCFELSRLNTGVCAIYQQNWVEAVLCQVDRAKHSEKVYEYKTETDEFEQNRIKIAHWLLCSENERGGLIPAPEFKKLVLVGAYSGQCKYRLLRALKTDSMDEDMTAMIFADIFPMELPPPDRINADSVREWRGEMTDRFELRELFGADKATKPILMYVKLLADSDREWAKIYKILKDDEPSEVENSGLRRARGRAFEAVCLNAQDAKLNDCVKILKRSVGGDRALAELLEEHIETGRVRRRNEHSPYTAVLKSILGGNGIMDESSEYIADMDFELWDAFARARLRGYIECGTETENILLGLLIQSCGRTAGTAKFYSKWNIYARHKLIAENISEDKEVKNDV